MRTFLVLCLIAIAYADNLGYDYQPTAHSGGDLSPGAGDDLSHGVPSNAHLAPSSSAPSYDAPSYSASAAPELEKEFYTFTADDAEFDDPNAGQRIASSLKQGLRVVFIKGPENKGLEDAALALAKQAAQQKTDIYVLNKQADIGGLADKLKAVIKNANNRPEVHFVKYRTPEDASNAQKAIQSQYDTLPGNSQTISGGYAPVINFASQAAARIASSPQSPQLSYLPSSLLRFRH